MAQFTVNPFRTDPYKGFKFRVSWDGTVVPGVTGVSGLVRHTEVVELRDAASPSVVRHTPGRTTYDPVTLTRGVTHDTTFEHWADTVWTLEAPAGDEVGLREYRKDVRLDLLDEAGLLVLRYVLRRAWPSSYQALPHLDANSASIALEQLVLQHEGWARDTSVTEPVEP